MQKRTIGVISLIGAEQANLIRAKLSQTLGEEVMQRHAILCGDSATFQGTERDIVFLSMVADPAHKDCPDASRSTNNASTWRCRALGTARYWCGR